MTEQEPTMRYQGNSLIESDEWYRFGVSPLLQQSIGGPESFYMYQVGLLGDVEADLNDQWLASAGVYINL